MFSLQQTVEMGTGIVLRAVEVLFDLKPLESQIMEGSRQEPETEFRSMGIINPGVLQVDEFL